MLCHLHWMRTSLFKSSMLQMTTCNGAAPQAPPAPQPAAVLQPLPEAQPAAAPHLALAPNPAAPPQPAAAPNPAAAPCPTAASKPSRRHTTPADLQLCLNGHKRLQLLSLPLKKKWPGFLTLLIWILRHKCF
ncbi:nematocyst expressed protein 3-like [Scylla paramamosain]|uniref:nematocyst expressed protein 3-like n=1 Tax=Scylla paramamosain TaxID=85552 RepID=UPI0030833EF9